MFRTTLKKSALAAVAVAATAAAIAPAAASAATVNQAGGTLSVNALSGETNNMRVTLTDSYLEILENNSGGVQPQAGTTCITFSPGHARCNLAGVSFIRVNAGDMSDLVVGDIYSSSRAFTMTGGTGQRLPRRDGLGRQPRVHPRRGRRRPALRPPVRRHDLRRQRRRHHRGRRRRRLAQRRPRRRPHRRRRGERLHLRQGRDPRLRRSAARAPTGPRSTATGTAVSSTPCTPAARRSPADRPSPHPGIERPAIGGPFVVVAGARCDRERRRAASPRTRS